MQAAEAHPMHGLRHTGTRLPVLEPIEDTEGFMLHAGALYQDIAWWDAKGYGHRITKIEDSYLQNLEGFLLREAPRMYLELPRLPFATEEYEHGRAEICPHCQAIVQKAVDEGLSIPPQPSREEFLADTFFDDFDVEKWCKSTPLYKAIRAEMKKRGVFPKNEF